MKQTVYLSVYWTDENGVEHKLSPERGMSVADAIAFLQKYGFEHNEPQGK